MGRLDVQDPIDTLKVLVGAHRWIFFKGTSQQNDDSIKMGDTTY